MSKQDGGPAFPVSMAANMQDLEGMTLRDYFAGQAMQAHAATAGFSGSPDDATLANWAYHLADAMLAEREKDAS